MNETIKNILKRRSVRSYQPKQIPDDILAQILEVGKYAPSGMGM